MLYLKDVNRDDLSPMMKGYYDVKKEHPNELVFYQLGDFYEMFFDDAMIASSVLELTLTGRDCGLSERAPMCGLPIHAVENYLTKLVQAGYKVVLISQTSEPTKNSKELVERSITKIVTAGTLTDNLDEKKNNYILSVASKKGVIGIAYADITTGKLNMIMADSVRSFCDTLNRIMPSEIICNGEGKLLEKNIKEVSLSLLPPFYAYQTPAYEPLRAEKVVKKHFNVNSLKVFDITENDTMGICAVGGLIEYLNETQRRNLTNINKITVEKPNEYMYIDTNTRKNLEITENMTTKRKKGSLIGILDKTQTSMGARLLKNILDQPSVIENVINDRLDAVDEFIQKRQVAESVITILSRINDIERLTGKIGFGSINPADCNTLKNSLIEVNNLRKLLVNTLTAKNNVKAFSELQGFEPIISKLDSAICEDAGANIRNEGGFIKLGYNSELDSFKLASDMGRGKLSAIENQIKEETGIKNLKVSYNKVFGYFIEVTKSQINLVPSNWIRRQTTVNGERYINEELKIIEDKILSSGSLALQLENDLYNEIKEFLKDNIVILQKVSDAVAKLDVTISLATVAYQNAWVRPIINNSIDEINIVDGKHPVISSLLTDSSFVPNDCLLDTAENRTMIITGPNMAGKSTFMRQVAIITFMAHIGSFVPARKAEICITDRIFTRIGASDDLAFGQSTFMVEMTEVANILNNATNKSLLILDEIGRGTSTYDGLSIAWAVVEYLSKNLKTKTLFATHYHELTDLEGKIEGIKNYRVLVKELPEGIVFLHKIARGSANKSFGIEVASIAGLPKSIIERAKEILEFQERANVRATKDSFSDVEIKNTNTKENINTREILNILSDIDMNTVSPLVAFSTLQNLVDKVRKN